MSYYGRTVGRAKGVGKMVNWNQGGGPMKAGLGPQINVSTWARRVIARRTNSCCCDPIELTGITLSIPNETKPSSVDTAWNLFKGAGDNLGIVGPPQNDISGGQINTKRQIYAVATFNKVISYDDLRTLPTSSFTPLPDNTNIGICGLREVTDIPGPHPNTTDPRILNGTVICKRALSANATYVGYKYYALACQYTPVTQIPGGTITDTTNSTKTTLAGPQGHLRTGSRFLVSSTQTASNTDYGSRIANTSNPAGGIVTNFWSQSGVPDGTGNGSVTNPLAQQAFTDNYGSANPNNRVARALANTSDTVDPRVYGTFSSPLMNEKRGGFVSNLIGGVMGNQGQVNATLNRYLGNCMGVYMTGVQNEKCPGNTTTTVQNANICLVQGLGVAGPTVGPNPQPIFTVRPGFKEYYSADAVYVSNGPVPWLQGDYALFINITSLIQVALVKPSPNGKNNLASGGNNLVVGPPVGDNDKHPCWRDGNTGTIVTTPKGMFPDLFLLGIQDSDNSGPFQAYGIKDVQDGGGYIKPAYADCLWNALGKQNAPDVTFDASANGYNGTTVLIGPDAVGVMTLGDVVEKLRQSTYNLYSSYVIRDLLNSKYPCGNDGYDAPVADINIKSGDPVLAVADINEGNVLQL